MVPYAFWSSLGLTVVFLVISLVSGMRRRRRLHLITGPLTLALLGTAIVFAVKLGGIRDFPPAEMNVHRFFAVVGAFLALPVALTGVCLLVNPATRLAHRFCVVLFAIFTLSATATGVWVYLLSTPR